jgi:hypothetical protein
VIARDRLGDRLTSTFFAAAISRDRGVIGLDPQEVRDRLTGPFARLSQSA